MEDKLISQLQERFADHASAVDPGAWDAITHKLAVANGDVLRETLQQKFTGHEVEVGPQAWSNISNQLGHGAAAGTTSSIGWWAAGIAATVVAGAALVFSLKESPAPPSQAEPPALVAEQPAAATNTNDPAPLTTTTAPATQAAPTVSGTATDHTGTTTVPHQATNPNANAGAQRTPRTEPSTAPGKNASDNTTPEGERTVNAVLQDIVDHYVTSPVVVATEKQVPPPSQKEMPSQEVHVQRDVPDATEQEPAEPEAQVPAPQLEVMIPTAFSPNGDGINDELIISVQNYQKAVVRIFSATSNALVFSADDLETRWNGRVMNSGQPCEPGMYFYALEITDNNGRTTSKGEVVRLFR